MPYLMHNVKSLPAARHLLIKTTTNNNNAPIDALVRLAEELGSWAVSILIHVQQGVHHVREDVNMYGWQTVRCFN